MSSIDFGIKNLPGRAPAAQLENIHRAALAEHAMPSPAEQLALIRAERKTKRPATCSCMHTCCGVGRALYGLWCLALAGAMGRRKL